MEYFYEQFQKWMMVGCFYALFISVSALFAVFVWEHCKDNIVSAWRNATQGKLHRQVFAAAFLLVSFYLGATKPSAPRVTYDGGIKAGATVNVVTNDTVSIYWQRDTSGGIYIPESAAVYIDYRPNTATNEEWGLLAQTTVGAWGWSGTVQNATNYDYSVWAYYIPPEPVHTNGVWTYKTHFDRNSDYAIPLRARIEVNGKAIATPKEVRKDEENDD